MRRTGERAQGFHRFGRLISDQEHAQTVGVLELKGRVAFTQLFPQPPDAEAPLADHRVVEDDHAASG